MAKVDCTVEEVQLENDHGQLQAGVRVTCSDCDYCTESFGTGGASVRRCLAQLRENCPEGMKNYYEADYDD